MTEIPSDGGTYVAGSITSEESSTRVIRRMDLDQLEDSVATLLVISGHCRGEIHTLETKLTLGRGAECDIVIPDDGISREHCRFVRVPAGVAVEDLGSTNGTWVGRQRIRKRTHLPNGARVRLGAGTILRFALQTEVDRAYYEDLRAAAVRDPLTGLYNKRHLHERLPVELAYSARHGEPLALVIVDLDRFKQINDGYGHAAGDVILAGVGQILASCTRTEDVVSRFGGDEFVILARNTTVEGARELAERVRRAVKRAEFAHEGRRIPVTLSVGVAATAGEPTDSAEALFGAADAALYEVKARGRDGVAATTP